MVSAQAGTNALTYASDWGLEKSTPGLVAFETWVNRHAAASDPAVKAKMVAEEGFALAQQRRQSFAELIRTNPAQALASTVPVSVRQQLPGEIISQLETRVAGIGDFSVVCVLPRATDSRSASIHRFVRLDGRTYHAQVYGRRATETTKYGIPLHGVALDDRLALHESGARQLEAGEAQETTRAFVDLRPPAFQTQDSSLPLLAEVGDWLCRFTTPEQLHLAEERLTAAEAGMSPKVKSPYGEIIRSLMGDASGTQSLPTPPPVEGPQPNKTWTQGQQQVLTIRVSAAV